MGYEGMVEVSMGLYAPYITREMEERRKKVREFAEKELAPLRQEYEEKS